MRLTAVLTMKVPASLCAPEYQSRGRMVRGGAITANTRVIDLFLNVGSKYTRICSAVDWTHLRDTSETQRF